MSANNIKHAKLKELQTNLKQITAFDIRKFDSLADRAKAIVESEFGEEASKIQDIQDRRKKWGLMKLHISQLKSVIEIAIDKLDIRIEQESEFIITPNPESSAYNWSMINIHIEKVAKNRFENGHYADAVEASFKEINDIVKKQYRNKKGSEEDGDSLMRKAFTSTQNNEYTPVFKLADNSTESGRNIQQGYMEIFAGSIKGIRNPKAHANHNIIHEEAWEMIVLASHLMRMWGKYN